VKLGWMNYLDFEKFEVGIIIESSPEIDKIFEGQNKISACHQYAGVCCDYYEGNLYYFPIIDQRVNQIQIFDRDWNYELFYSRKGILNSNDISQEDIEKIREVSIKDRRSIMYNNLSFITYKAHRENMSKLLNKFNCNEDISDIVVKDFVEAFSPCTLRYKNGHKKLKGFVVWENCD
jgi:hypothetical protein